LSFHLLKVHHDWLKGEEPQIRIAGLWLGKLGFLVDKQVLLEAKDGELILRVVTIHEE